MCRYKFTFMFHYPHTLVMSDSMFAVGQLGSKTQWHQPVRWRRVCGKSSGDGRTNRQRCNWWKQMLRWCCSCEVLYLYDWDDVKCTRGQLVNGMVDGIGFATICHMSFGRFIDLSSRSKMRTRMWTFVCSLLEYEVRQETCANSSKGYGTSQAACPAFDS